MVFGRPGICPLRLNELPAANVVRTGAREQFHDASHGSHGCAMAYWPEDSGLTGLQLLPVVLSLIVLGAHFMRAGSGIMVLIVLLLLGLLFVRRLWAARVVQAALLLGAVEWARTLVRLVAWRSQDGQPVLRLIVILGSVALFTGLSTLMFRAARLRRWFEPAARARPAAA